MQTTSELLILALVMVAAMIDIWRQRIPNVLTIGGAVAGIVLSATGASDVLVRGSVLGFAIGLMLMLPGHALGATGAGDAKLMAAVGALAGPQRVALIFLYTAIAGGILAMAYAAGRGRLSLTMQRTTALVRAPRDVRAAIESTGAPNRFPYAPAIAVGTIWVFWQM